MPQVAEDNIRQKQVPPRSDRMVYMIIDYTILVLCRARDYFFDQKEVALLLPSSLRQKVLNSGKEETDRAEGKRGRPSLYTSREKGKGEGAEGLK